MVYTFHQLRISTRLHARTDSRVISVVRDTLVPVTLHSGHISSHHLRHGSRTQLGRGGGLGVSRQGVERDLPPARGQGLGCGIVALQGAPLFCLAAVELTPDRANVVGDHDGSKAILGVRRDSHEVGVCNRPCVPQKARETRPE